MAASETVKLPLLQDPEKLNLERPGHLSYFIEENGSFPGGFEFSLHPGIRPGEGFFFMAEEFIVQKRFREARAVDGDKGFFLPLPSIVKRPGNEFLAGSVFTGDKNRHILVQKKPDLLKHILHGQRLTDDTVQAIVAALFVHQEVHHVAELPGFHRPFEQHENLILVQGFFQIVVGPQSHGPDDYLKIPVPRDHHHVEILLNLPYLGENIQAVLAGQIVIEKNNIQPVFPDDLQGRTARRGFV